nr:VanZ family protein [Photobacterium galatheae]
MTQFNALYLQLKTRKLLHCARALFWGHGLLITWLTLMPPAEKGTLTDLKSYGIAHLDFILHALCYGLFATLALLISKHRQRYLYVLMCLGFYGSLLEALQGTLQPGRESSISDAMANLTGVILGGLLSWSLLQSSINRPPGNHR